MGENSFQTKTSFDARLLTLKLVNKNMNLKLTPRMRLLDLEVLGLSPSI